jgi:pilus assembly protein CpaC
MDRSVVQNLGINWQALGTIGSIATFPALNLAVNAGVAPACTAIGIAACQGVNFNGVIDALAQDNLARVLAEPNLTVISGQAASFLVGGEYPIPVGQGNGQVSISFKKYGISLSFLPTILSDGRINLHVNPEISELTSQGAVQLTAGNSSIQVPALTIRSAESTVELGSGQSFALAGLLEDTTTQSVVGLPFLQDLPILGTLFRSVSFQHNETELVILVTPFVVKPVDSDVQLHLPTDTYTQPTDLERILFARQVGRSQGALPAQMRIPGNAGFIVQ